MKNLIKFKSCLTRLRGLTLILIALCTIGVGNMWGETYALVKDASALSAGDKILIVSAGRSVKTKISGTDYTATYSDQAMNTTTNNNHVLGDDVTISDSKITSTTAKEFTLGGTSTAWTIYNDDNTYLYTDAKNKLLLGTSANALTFTISINSTSGVATITTTKSDFALNNNGSSKGSLVLRMYAASTNQSTASKYFVLYAASNTSNNYDVFIYKKVQTCTPLGQINGSLNLTQADGAKITWTKVTGATGYKLKVTDKSTNTVVSGYDYSNLEVGDVDNYTITGLPCGGGTTYQVRIIATNASNSSYCIGDGPEYSGSDPLPEFQTQSCSCDSYSFHYGTDGQSDWNTENVCFVENGDDGNGGKYYTSSGFELPEKQHFYLGWKGSGNYDNAKSKTVEFKYMPQGTNRAITMGVNPSSGNTAGALVTLRVRSSYNDDNKYIEYFPEGYVFRWGTGDSWSSIPLKATSSDYWATVWEQDGLTEINATNAAYHYYVGLKTKTDYVWCNNSEDKNGLSTNMTKRGPNGNTAGGKDDGKVIAGLRGKFRIWADNNIKNWNAHFVPYYHVTYNGNGASGTMAASADVSCEGDDAARTVQAAANGFTVPTGKQFAGWATSAENAIAGTVTYAAGANIVLTSDITLYAVWKDNNYTVTLQQSPAAGATLTGATTTAHYSNTINLSTTVPDGYRFVNWTTSDGVTITNATSETGASFTMPAKNVTITANFKKTWTVTWMSNGAKYGEAVTYDDGAALVLPTTNPTAPSSCSTKVFVGWTEDAEITTATDTKPTLLDKNSLGTVTSDKTYRAVFADVTGSETGYIRVTDVSTLANNDKIVIVSNKYSKALIVSSNAPAASSSTLTETNSKITVSKEMIWTLGDRTVDAINSYVYFTLSTSSRTNTGATTLGAESVPSSGSASVTLNSSNTEWRFVSHNTNGMFMLYPKSGTLVALELYSSSSSGTPSWTIYKNNNVATNDYTALKIYKQNLSMSGFITVCSTCQTPSDVVASEITSSSATISWSGVSQENTGGSDTGFKVVWSTSSTRPTPSASNSATVSSDLTEYTINGLEQGTKYYVWVQALCDNSWSGSENFTTKKEHTVTFYATDGSVLETKSVLEGADITYTQTTPTTCDEDNDPSDTFVGWATKTWEDKKTTQGDIPSGTTFYDKDNLPKMGEADIKLYAVFAKQGGEPLTNHQWIYTFTTKFFQTTNETKTMDGKEGETTVNKNWQIQALAYDEDYEEQTVSMGSVDNTKGTKVGASNNNGADYLYLSSTDFAGTITALKIYTSGNSGVNSTLSVVLSEFKSNGNDDVSITNSNTEYSFTGSKTINKGDEIQFIWVNQNKDVIYIKQIEVDYTTGGDLSYSNYLTLCSQCTTPNNLQNSDITEEGATISWSGVSNSGTTGFTVLWSKSSTRPTATSSNTQATDASTKTATLTGLEAGTTYYVWVKSNCNDTWSSTYTSFTTKAIHTITFQADYGTISGGSLIGSGVTPQTASIVDGETLTFPTVTGDGCGEFVGWTTIGEYDDTSKPSTFYTASEELANITADATYTAVYRTTSGAAQTIVDNLTATLIDYVTYQSWNNLTINTGAVYAGYTTKNTSSDIQMKKGDNSGIITSKSGGKIKKVVITWGATSGHTVDIYGKNTAYSSTADLYSESTRGTLIGSLTDNSTTELNIEQDYAYIGLVSNQGAVYIKNLAIQWYGSPMHYMTTPTCNPMLGIEESLTAMSYVYNAGPSAAQSFAVSGTNLTAAATVTAPANFEVSTAADSTYSQTLNLNQVNGNVSATLYIRLKSGLNVGTYSGKIQVTSTGATTVESNTLTGTVTKAAATLTFTNFNATNHYEAELVGSSVTIPYFYTYTGDGTVNVSRSPATGSIDKTAQTITVSAVGTWTLTAKATVGTNYNKPADAAATVIVYKADRYYDNIHADVQVFMDIALPIVERGDYTAPDLMDADNPSPSATACADTHYKFIGWISKTAIDSGLANDEAYKTALIPAGKAMTASGESYYAVWAEDK